MNESEIKAKVENRKKTIMMKIEGLEEKFMLCGAQLPIPVFLLMIESNTAEESETTKIKCMRKAIKELWENNDISLMLMVIHKDSNEETITNMRKPLEDNGDEKEFLSMGVRKIHK
jgi:hypothetical protein